MSQDTPNDGGPAFPDHYHPAWVRREGMSLRDYFAAKAMQSMDTSYTMIMCLDKGSVPPNWNADISKSAYQMADAMLAARDSNTQQPT